MRRFAFVAGTLIGLLVGASFAGVLCHVSGATNEIFAAQYALFFVYGLLLTGYFGALGYVITRSLVGSQECSEEAATRPHAFSDDPDVVVAEIVEESKPAVPRSSSGLGARIAPWGWLLGWLGILLAGVTAIRRPWSAEIYPLGIAAVVLVLGIILTLACLMAALSDRSRSCTLHAVAGLLVNFVCFVVVAVSGVATVGIDLAQAARRERAAQRQNISARPRFDPSPNRFRIPRAVPQPAPAVRPTLQEAVARNDTKEVERYIKEGAELNEVYRDRQTLLIRAVTRGNRDVVRLLLEHDAGVNGNPDAGLHPISLALDGGQLEIAQMLLQYDPELNVVDIRGYSPLHHCARHGYEELAEDLISRGIPINSQTKDRRTALIVALNERKPEFAAMLLEHGPDLTIADGYGFTALHYAARHGYEQIVEDLLADGAEVDASDRDRQTPLHLAAQANRLSIVRLLAEHGANVDITDNNGYTPLQNAALGNHTDVAKALIDMGADVDAMSQRHRRPTALYESAVRNNVPLAQYLLDHEAEPNAAVNANETPMKTAIERGYTELVNLLVSQGAQLSMPGGMATLRRAFQMDNPELHQILIDNAARICAKNGLEHLLGAAVEVRKIDLVETVIERGADLEAELASGMTALVSAIRAGDRDLIVLLLDKGAKLDTGDPLCAAVEKDDPELVELLLDRGADVHRGDPLKTAIQRRSTDIAQLLIDRGAKVDEEQLRTAIEQRRLDMAAVLLKNFDENTAGSAREELLMAALARRDLRTAELLIQQGADVNAVSSRGNSALHVATEQAAPNIVRLLLEKGANVNATNDYGQAPLLRAVQTGNCRLVEILLEGGADIAHPLKDGLTALHYAAKHSNPDMVELLASRASELDLQDRHYNTPLYLAGYRTNGTEVVRILLKYGADVNANAKIGRSAIFTAAEKDSIETVKLLLAKGADATARNEDGWNVLHQAARSSSTMIKLLVDHGADLKGRDADGMTPLHRAAKAGNEEAVKALIELGADTQARCDYGRTPRETAERAGRSTAAFDSK